MRRSTDWTGLLAPRLNALRFSPARQVEIIEELSQHLDDRVDELVAQGLPVRDAELTAAAELKDAAFVPRLSALRQAHVNEPPVAGQAPRRFLGDFLQDIRYGWRSLLAHKAFSAAAVLTLTLGIGANTAIFSLVNALLLRPLPVADPASLIWISNAAGSTVFSYPEMADLRDHNDAFSAVAAWGPITASLNADGATDQVPGLIVSGNYFDVLGVNSAAGRLLRASDDVTPGAHPVAAISYRLWQGRFGGKDDIVGRNVLVNGRSFSVIGVVERGFRSLDGSARDLFVPMMMQAVARPPRAGFAGEMNPDLLSVRTNTWVFAAGRLKPGVTLDRAVSSLSATMTAVDRSRQPTAPEHRMRLFPMSLGAPGQRAQIVPVARLLFSVVGAVLLIAAVNVANLLLSRATTRRREIAVRLALGASRWRLVRQFLTESVLLSVISAAGGVALAWAIAAGFRAAPPPPGALPVGLEFAIDYRVLFFTLVLSIATGILFGLAPALGASRPSLVPALKDDGQATGEKKRRMNMRKALVIVEVALSLMLIVTAGLFVRSLRETQAISPGFDADRVLNAPLNINLLRYTTAQGREFYQRVVERMESLPGVESAAVARVPVFGPSRVSSLRIEGVAGSSEIFQSTGSGVAGTNRNAVNTNVIGPGYLKTMGIRLVEGREFESTDVQGGEPVVLVNQTFSAVHLSGASPIGRRISFRGEAGPWQTIVGVVADTKYATLSEPFAPIAYVPLAQNHETGMTLHVRTSVPPETLISAVRKEIQSLEPNLPIPWIQPLSETIGSSLYAARMGAWSIGILGGLALLLAAVGVYGVLAFSIARRTREIGIRVALGAERSAIVRLVLAEGMWLASCGVAVGLAAAAYVATPLARFLYGVQSHDIVAFALAPVILLSIAMVACLIPAVKALRVQPTTALKS